MNTKSGAPQQHTTQHQQQQQHQQQHSRRRSVVLPPVRPSPTQPIPSVPAEGPNGTIRGASSRPRGATISTVSEKSKAMVNGGDAPRARPRSLLVNEVMPYYGDREDAGDCTTGTATTSATTTTTGATDSFYKMRRTSSAAEAYPAPPLTSGASSSAASAASSSPMASSSRLSVGETRSRSGSGNLFQQQHLQSRPRSHASFVIAVVGHKNAGKSTVIRKGLRQFGLSRPTVLSERITSHSTVCIVDQEQRTIEVLEMDASVLLNGPSKRFAWPRSLPYIDAAILCYDASQISSFRGMSELLENFAMNHLSTVMLACKSELSPKAVDPYYASDMASVYNVGLAECSVQSEEGKKRMRDCFSYLVKEVAKSRASMRVFDTPEFAAPSPDEEMETKRKRADRKMSDVTIGSIDGVASEEDSALQQSINRAQLGLQSAKSAGGYVSIEELYDKFFFAAVSGNDERFLHMFMTFYRGFARPIELLNQIISRFDALSRGEKSDGVMIRYSLMKLTTMLGDWMQEYPGDLSSAETFELLSDFFERLLHHPATMHVAAPMQPLLDVVRTAPDLDAAWSKEQDNDKPRSVAADVPPVKPLEQSYPEEEETHVVPQRTRSASDVTGSSEGVSDTLALPQKGMQKTVLRNLSNSLFDVSHESIAQELTRIEWDLFCTVGPRDLLRHILVSRKLRSTDSPIARSIAHFNYVSAWAASLILIQTKVKQRARMMEKFMEIATVLRKTNNYNTLHAILAGLSNASIHRLKHTRDLIAAKPVMKQYQSLTRLMGSERSFAAYRLALENSDGRTVPYLGVHLQDILSTSDGNPSKRASDGMIHWRKFSLMYDAVMAIVSCQQYQMPMTENSTLSAMILEQPVMDEDLLYQRSLYVEPRSAASGSASASTAGSQIIKQIFSLEL